MAEASVISKQIFQWALLFGLTCRTRTPKGLIIEGMPRKVDADAAHSLHGRFVFNHPVHHMANHPTIYRLHSIVQLSSAHKFRRRNQVALIVVHAQQNFVVGSPFDLRMQGGKIFWQRNRMRSLFRSLKPATFATICSCCVKLLLSELYT